MSTWLRNNRLQALAALAFALVAIAIVLIAYVAPEDADQGLSQKIFYFHVPIALTAYACFGWGAWKGLLHLWKRRPGADLESYVAIHHGVIFGVLTLVTGSIWAKISWGVWWAWSSNQLVLFLVLFLFYSAYFMLRYSIEPGPARENICAVYSLFGGKPALVRELYREAFRRFGMHLATVTPTEDPEEDLIQLGLAYRRSALADPHLYTVMFSRVVPGFSPDEEAAAEAVATFEPLLETVRRGVRAGVFVDVPERIALASWGMVHGLVSLELGGHLPAALDVGANFEATLRATTRGWYPAAG